MANVARLMIRWSFKETPPPETIVVGLREALKITEVLWI